VHIKELRGNEQQPEVKLPNGTTTHLGGTLGEWRRRYGGDVADVPDPADPGRTVRVDLTPWKDRDPDATVLRISFQFVDPTKIGTKFPGR
jgi:hypothetical protein